MNATEYTYSVILLASNVQEENQITLSSIAEQNHPSLEVIIANTSKELRDNEGPLPFPVQIIYFNTQMPATQIIAECLLLCKGKITTIVHAGDRYGTAALIEVERIFNSLSNVSWLTGYLIKNMNGILQKPIRHNQIRWSVLDFCTTQPKVYKYHIPFAGTFVKTEVWKNALPLTDPVFNSVPDIACWLKLFETEKLYSTYLTTAICLQPSFKYFKSLNEALYLLLRQKNKNWPWGLWSKRMIAWLFGWAFVANVPVLRNIQWKNFEYQPLINYDMEMDAYFFENFPPTRYLKR